MHRLPKVGVLVRLGHTAHVIVVVVRARLQQARFETARPDEPRQLARDNAGHVRELVAARRVIAPRLRHREDFLERGVDSLGEDAARLGRGFNPRPFGLALLLAFAARDGEVFPPRRDVRHLFKFDKSYMIAVSEF